MPSGLSGPGASVHPANSASVSSALTVTLKSDSPFAEIRYTTNGQIPDLASGTAYTKPFPLNLTTNFIVVHARAFSHDGTPGPLASNVYYSVNPVGHWNLNEGTGLSVLDQSGNGYTGTLGSATGILWTNGITGTACYFTRVAGSAFQISAGLAPACNILNNLTLSAWVNPINTTNTSLIVAKYSWNVDGYVFFLDTSSRPFIYTFNANNVSKTATASVALNVWSHVAVTYAYPEVKFYINGVSAGSFVTTGTIASPTTRTLQIGTSYSPNLFNGAIDNVRIYSSALTESQIADLYALEK